ncbi:RNA-directed DNA polymerase (Reverse transcriptase), partial [Trifolium medium]|nr:RNA-directed DNA polymerase (Reverse transcriptase) [Trifolium medium]
VHWKGRTVEEATWEDEIVIRSQFPKYSLEDKVNVEGEGIDRTQLNDEAMTREQLIHNDSGGPRPWIVYSRRKGRKGIGG